MQADLNLSWAHMSAGHFLILQLIYLKLCRNSFITLFIIAPVWIETHLQMDPINVISQIEMYSLYRIKVLQALHQAPSLHLHQASAITLSKKNVFYMLCLTLLQGIKKISETVLKL